MSPRAAMRSPITRRIPRSVGNSRRRSRARARPRAWSRGYTTARCSVPGGTRGHESVGPMRRGAARGPRARGAGAPPLVLGGTALGAAGSDVPIILRDTLGINVKLVDGYLDSGAIFLAVDRGELNGRTVDLSSMKSFRPAWMAPNGGMRALVQFARATRHPEFADVPTARELARNDEARAVIELAELSYRISRPFAAPPDVPAARARALQDAFMAVHQDAAYLEDAAKLRLEVSPINSRAVLDTIDRIAAGPPSVLDYLRRIMTPGKGG